MMIKHRNINGVGFVVNKWMSSPVFLIQWNQHLVVHKESHLVKIQVTMYFSSKCEPICQPNILFHSLQVQPINVKNGTFSYAYDCTGFFNIPILMGLITTGVLLIILFIAVLVMFSLTTMDRFDDPKGPTIHVATG